MFGISEVCDRALMGEEFFEIRSAGVQHPLVDYHSQPCGVWCQ